VASKRRNPKKNKAARRRRPDRPGLRRARLEIEDIHHLMAAAPPAALPLVGLTSLWLWNLAEDQAAAAHCVDGCLTLHYALAEFGIGSHVEAITICIERAAAGSAPGAMYGQHPRYNADGTFNGHTILVVTGAGRFIDPTIQQFREVPHTKQAMLPLQAPCRSQAAWALRLLASPERITSSCTCRCLSTCGKPGAGQPCKPGVPTTAKRAPTSRPTLSQCSRSKTCAAKLSNRPTRGSARC
jgi:hypothetical protein